MTDTRRRSRKPSDAHSDLSDNSHFAVELEPVNGNHHEQEQPHENKSLESCVEAIEAALKAKSPSLDAIRTNAKSIASKIPGNTELQNLLDIKEFANTISLELGEAKEDKDLSPAKIVVIQSLVKSIKSELPPSRREAIGNHAQAMYSAISSSAFLTAVGLSTNIQALLKAYDGINYAYNWVADKIPIPIPAPLKDFSNGFFGSLGVEWWHGKKWIYKPDLNTVVATSISAIMTSLLYYYLIPSVSLDVDPIELINTDSISTDIGTAFTNCIQYMANPTELSRCIKGSLNYSTWLAEDDEDKAIDLIQNLFRFYLRSIAQGTLTYAFAQPLKPCTNYVVKPVVEKIAACTKPITSCVSSLFSRAKNAVCGARRPGNEEDSEALLSPRSPVV